MYYNNNQILIRFIEKYWRKIILSNWKTKLFTWLCILKTKQFYLPNSLIAEIIYPYTQARELVYFEVTRQLISQVRVFFKYLYKLFLYYFLSMTRGTDCAGRALQGKILLNGDRNDRKSDIMFKWLKGCTCSTSWFCLS